MTLYMPIFDLVDKLKEFNAIYSHRLLYGVKNLHIYFKNKNDAKNMVEWIELTLLKNKLQGKKIEYYYNINLNAN